MTTWTRFETAATQFSFSCKTSRSLLSTMPSAERNGQDDDNDRDRKQKSSSSSKSKDLSHVPCKFFKVGSCTAGSSCPFSHSLVEPGGQKDVCAWFVKGNCKFAHKCALAHILPGQSMAMDRKNKKAAQVAAGGKEPKSRSSKNQPPARNQLLSGSTAPTRPARSPMSMPLKATISPSAPAPPLKDTDFNSSLANLDDDAKLPTAPAQGKPAAVSSPADPPAPVAKSPESPPPPPQPPVVASPKSPPGLPVGSPTAPRRPVQPTPAVDFGPIGSPPRSAASPHVGSLSRTNGFSPATSPSHRDLAGNYLSTSPFSAPGNQSMYAAYGGETSRAGIAQSLGTGLAMQGRAWNNDYGPIPSQVMGSRTPRSGVDFDINLQYENHHRRRGQENAVDDDDLEDFIPSSLTDLLTPDERNRRMSRSNSGQPPSAYPDSLLPGLPSTPTNGHRYSRSVPGTSLLGGGEVKSIWAENNTSSSTAIHAALPSSPPRMGLGDMGTPGSFKSALDLSAQSPGHSIISPTNASAAFLPGLHQHYLKAKQASTGIGMGAGLGRGIRNVSSPLYPSGPNTSLPPGPNNVSTSIGNYLQSTGMSGSPSQVHTFAQPMPYDPLVQNNANSDYLRGMLPIPNLSNGMEADNHILSPSSRALQSHAPGQSLPQGLAAGYSRIHALPPLPLASPGSVSGLNMGSPGLVGSMSEWGGPETSISPPGQQSNGPGLGGLESMFSTLSYSAAASRGAPTGRVGAPPGLSRSVSGSKNWQGTGSALSPLSGTVVSGNADDELFEMEG
ncbi:hypothetical protein HGRIS_011223 [Hohenbuehelia grisea]|uniref:C3H1-type domain-containing protein n=1 Tax=Hohenbuehelia grisea TaxID=104357 RepID=A0ABR3JW72_9AGAR